PGRAVHPGRPHLPLPAHPQPPAGNAVGAIPDPVTRARLHSHPGRVLLPSGLLRQPRFHVGAPPSVRKRSQTTTPEPAPFAPGAGTVRGPAPALVYVGAPPSVRKRSQTTPPNPPAFAPGAGAPTVPSPAPAPVSCRSTALGAKAESNHNPRARPLRTRGGYRPASCASPGFM